MCGRVTRPLLYLCAALLGAGCAGPRPYVAADARGWETIAPPPEARIAYTVFLLGDAGDPSAASAADVLRLLRTRLAAANTNAAVIFLGDNLYCCGLADSGNARRPQDEERLEALLSAVEDFRGRVVFIPGNHDWNDGREGGLEAVRRQERYLERRLGDDVFLPGEGFPGPAEVKLTPRLTLLAIDTQWWLHPGERPYGDTGDYDLADDEDFLLQLDDAIGRHRDDDLLVVGHHPVVSNGTHAGHLPLRDHLFPLTNVATRAYLPLPVVGSAYPLFVRFFGGRQDLAHPRYRMLRRGLEAAFGRHERLVYASGHDHALQYLKADSPYAFHQVVSGTASRSVYVGRSGSARFTASAPGFAILRYYDDGAAWLDVLRASPGGAADSLLFRTQMLPPARELVAAGVPDTAELPSYRDSVVVAAVNSRYRGTRLKRLLLGSHNRDVWATPVDVPVLDLGTEAGGLTPVKRGGGQQTISLRLKAGNGKEYVLRTLDKDPARTVPRRLQGTVATDIVQDQVSSIQPFGAFVVPPLAEAAGVYHTNPVLVYVPDDPRLGVYRETFRDRIMMLEERPNDDESDRPRFGRSRDVVSPFKLYREINDDNDHRVDQHAFLRARLLDMLISDWDRHRDQWRWASFEPYEIDPTLEGDDRTAGKIYRPIPRDRDWAFNRLTGLPSLARFIDPKFQDFDTRYGSLRGLTLNGLEQDRRFLNALTRADFVAEAVRVRDALTDSVIDGAVRRLPAAVYAREGDRLARLLRVRRDKLPAVAEAFYAMHARIVDVVGSDKHERFEVERFADDSMRVTVYKTSREGAVQKPVYARTFRGDETAEVRLFGLDGRDQFVVDGESGGGIRLIAVGGPGEDTFIDHSFARGFRRHARFFDTSSGNAWDLGPDAVAVRSSDPFVNRYDPHDYQYDVVLPITYFGANDDDGVFAGGGVRIIRHGFRKAPYAAMHVLKGNVAARTRAFNVVYEGHFVAPFGGWDVAMRADYLSPNSIRNFYGLGNETSNTRGDREYYRARLTQFSLAPALAKTSAPGFTLRVGPTLQITRVREDEDRVVAEPQPGVSDRTFDDQWFAGLEAALDVATLDDAVNPRQGIAWTNELDVNVGVRNATDSFTHVNSAFTVYAPLSYDPRVTLVARIGAAHNIGNFPFYRANTLGGRDNLRGYLSTRFAGRTSLFQNLELRAELLRFSTYVAIGRAGLLGFVDNGRVWSDDDPSTPSGTSRTWHQGYGGGVWVDLFGTFVLTTTAGFSEDGRTMTLKFGYLF